MLARAVPLVALGGALLAALPASAHGGTQDAPAPSKTVRPLFLSQEGCGAEAGPGRLELRPQVDSADGCGTVGGLPANELRGAPGDDFTSTAKLGTVLLDGKRRVTGQVAASSWFGAGGVGTVTFDVTLTGTTASGQAVPFGTTTVSASAEPAENVAGALFSFKVPAGVTGKPMREFVLNVVQRGLNVGMSAKQYSGSSWVALPVKPGRR